MKLSILMISAVCRMILYVSSVCHDSLTRNLKKNSDRKIRWSKIRALERKVNVFLFSPPLPPSRVRDDRCFFHSFVLCFKLFLFVSLVNTRLSHSLHWVAINLFCPHLNSCENVICLTSVEQKCIVVNNKCIAVPNILDLFYFSFAPSSLKIFLVPFWLLHIDLFLLFVSSRFESARSCIEHVCLLPHCTVLEVQWCMIQFNFFPC